jgi:UDP-N-acetylglucosamine 2-epimerase (non-hydrolysing)
MKVTTVMGARPNFVKMAPVIGELRRRKISQTIVHTGQHYDTAMSRIFMEDLAVPKPDHMLAVGSGSHAIQTARVMERLEPVLVDERPDLVLVPGDVNSTLAASLVAAKLQIPVGHVEAGLRSFDRSMPEEVNRVVVDELSELLFVHSESAVENLAHEGVPPKRIHFVGNTMIDTLIAMRPRITASQSARRLGLTPGGYLLVTLHRPALVDGPVFELVLRELARLATRLPVVFPVHPRSRVRLSAEHAGGILLLDPAGYVEFLSLVSDSAAVLTDSGGVQEETTFLGIPCFTFRENTERPVTVKRGTNTLLGLDPARIREIPALIGLTGRHDRQAPPLWDGRAATRVVDVLSSF